MAAVLFEKKYWFFFIWVWFIEYLDVDKVSWKNFCVIYCGTFELILINIFRTIARI